MKGGVGPEDEFQFVPLVIIGAARSGTNALRDALTKLPGFATWPCDEINPIWRHGNVAHPDDALPYEKATPKVRKYIRDAFRRIWRQQGHPRFVVEKTCANTLRVPFVDAILPEARFVHIMRDGYDVLASAKKRWEGGLEIPGLRYFLAKARYAPFSDLPRYALSAIRTRLAVRAGRRTHLEWWGPRFPQMKYFSSAPLEEIVARQWAISVTESHAAFARIRPERVFFLRYEVFASDPAAVLKHISNWLGAPMADDTIAMAAALVRSDSVGKGRAAANMLSPEVHALLDRVLEGHGYGP